MEMQSEPESSAKRQKLEERSLHNLVENLKKINICSSNAPATLKDKLVEDIRAGPCLLGTYDEEEAYYVRKKAEASGCFPSKSLDMKGGPEPALFIPDSTDGISTVALSQPVRAASAGSDEDMGSLADLEETADALQYNDEMSTIDSSEYLRATSAVSGKDMGSPAGESLIRYKAQNERAGGAADDREIILGDTEGVERCDRNEFDYKGRSVHVKYILGKKWEQRIRQLYDVQPLKHPDHMNVTLHDYQLKAAAQGHYSCESKFKGFLLGDYMGLGKTLAAIVMLWLVKDQPGFSLVVAPKSLCPQWVSEIESAWEPGFGLTVHYLEGSSLSAHDLHALAVDVVVCSYEQVEASGRARSTFEEELKKYRTSGIDTVKRPVRPTATLHSSLWREIGLPIKRLVLDEGQVVNKCDGKRHLAIKELHYKAAVVLSGTLAHNKWHDFSGYVDYLKGHPFTSHTLFLRAFATLDNNGSYNSPSTPMMRRLQRFLQAFTIARPPTILGLKPCTRFQHDFKLDNYSNVHVDIYMKKYNGMRALERENPGMFKEGSCLAQAVRAQLCAMHRILFPGSLDHLNLCARPKAYGRLMDDDDPITGFFAADSTMVAGDARARWLEYLQKYPYPDIVAVSPRTCHIIAVYQQLREDKPTEKMIIASQFVKYLDIVAEVLKRLFGIVALRYDGTVSHSQRLKVQQQFKDADPSVPLLITAGAGGCGLNITCASVVIITETWWNSNSEKQLIGRVWRQLQAREVTVVQLFAINSAIDWEIKQTQMRKFFVNSELMKPIVRLPDEGPEILEPLEKEYIPPPTY